MKLTNAELNEAIKTAQSAVSNFHINAEAEEHLKKLRAEQLKRARGEGERVAPIQVTEEGVCVSDPYAGRPEWATHVATDASGGRYYYSGQPEQGGSAWISSGLRCISDNTTCPHWRSTLERLPPIYKVEDGNP